MNFIELNNNQKYEVSCEFLRN